MVRLSLRHRVLLILSGFIVLSICLGLILIWYTFRIEHLLASITQKDLIGFRNAEALENTLMKQKGLASYYILDGDAGWLHQQAALRQEFLDQLARIKDASEIYDQRQALNDIEAEYQQYVTQKSRVVELFQSGNRAEGATVHRIVHGHFASLIRRCEQYKQFHTNRILAAETQSHTQAQRLRILALAAIVVSAGLTLLLAFVFLYQILEPLRRLTLEANRATEPVRTGNEVKTLSRRVRLLLHDVDQTHFELVKSRESLVQAEKMALVGKLAASMAHSIRNPFTSVKMRLFSLSRSLDLDEVQKEDVEVISEEIRHIDTIVQNFLEFSRPPKLKMQTVSPSSVVDSALRLLKHRLKSYQVTVTVDRLVPLPAVQADIEQLKEVVVNIMVNACEAMTPKGTIRIEEREEDHPVMGRSVVIRVCDSGPGIPRHLVGKVFQPFFSTKEQGTGLGLSIALRIITEHRGRLEVASHEGEGAVFTITLPAMEPTDEHDSDH